MDYVRTRSLIAESTGIDDIYDPDAEPLTREQIDEILRGGLSLGEALRLALINNRSLQAAFMEIGIAKADWVQSGLFTNPSLGLSMQFPEGGGRSNFQATLAQNIVDLWQIPVRRRMSQRALDETILRIARQAGQLAAETQTAYFEAVAATRLYELSKENYDLVGQTHEAVKAQTEAGTVSELDENLARGQVLSAEVEVRNARLAMANAKRRLARQLSLGRDIDDLVLVDDLRSESLPPLSADEWILVARESRLDLRAMEQAVASARGKADLETLKVFPDISIGPSLERIDRRASPGRSLAADFARASIAGGSLTVPDIQTRGQRRRERSQEIDALLGPIVTLTLPIWDQNQAQIAKAEYHYVQALLEYEAMHLSIAQDIRTTMDVAMTVSSTVEYYRLELLPQAERNLGFARAAYAAGQANLLFLLEAQRVLLATRRAYVQVRADAATALAALESTVGLPLDRIRHRSDSSPKETDGQEDDHEP